MPSVCVGGGVGGFKGPPFFCYGVEKGWRHAWVLVMQCSHAWIENTHTYTLHPMFSNINNTLLVIFVPYYIHVYGDQNGKAGGKDRHNLGNEN